MAFEIKPLLEADCVSLAKLYYRAMEHSIAAVLFSAAPSESSYALMGAQRADLIARPNIHAYKAIDPTTGHMIGAAYFMVEPEGVSQESLDNPSPMFTEFAPEQKVELWKAWAATMQAGYKKIIGTRPAVEVLMLLVEPEWQGKGVGSALLKIGCDEADRIGCISYVEATDDGIRAYERAGFKFESAVNFDPSPWGYDKKFPVDAIMLREPRAKH